MFIASNCACNLRAFRLASLFQHSTLESSREYFNVLGQCAYFQIYAR